MQSKRLPHDMLQYYEIPVLCSGMSEGSLQGQTAFSSSGMSLKKLKIYIYLPKYVFKCLEVLGK